MNSAALRRWVLPPVLAATLFGVMATSTANYRKDFDVRAIESSVPFPRDGIVEAIREIADKRGLKPRQAQSSTLGRRVRGERRFPHVLVPRDQRDRVGIRSSRAMLRQGLKSCATRSRNRCHCGSKVSISSNHRGSIRRAALLAADAVALTPCTNLKQGREIRAPADENGLFGGVAQTLQIHPQYGRGMVSNVKTNCRGRARHGRPAVPRNAHQGRAERLRDHHARGRAAARLRPGQPLQVLLGVER